VSVEASWQGLRVGPLMNNLAAAETKSPGLLKKAKESTIVGGTFFGSGKVTPHAEFNIWFNAEAEERQYLIAEMILLKRAKFRVETKSELTRGRMSIDSCPAPPMRSKCLGSVAG